MTAPATPDRRLAALAALFAADRAARILSRLQGPGAADAVAYAARLAAAPRRERLQALARALAADGAEVRERARAAAAAERPRVASILRTLGEGAPPDAAAAPLLVRLCRERLGR